MTDFDVIAAKLDLNNEALERFSTRLSKMEDAVTSLAVQNNMIINTQAQVDALWRKNDDNYGPDGLITKIKTHQMQCPKPQIARLWWAVGLLGTMYSATLAAVLKQVFGGG